MGAAGSNCSHARAAVTAGQAFGDCAVVRPAGMQPKMQSACRNQQLGSPAVVSQRCWARLAGHFMPVGVASIPSLSPLPLLIFMFLHLSHMHTEYQPGGTVAAAVSA